MSGRKPQTAKASGSGVPSFLVNLRADVIAGLTAAAVVLPKAMAYATVAGLPVAIGLYTAFIPTAIYALLGTSRVLSVSTTTTLAILAGTQLGQAVPAGDAAGLITAAVTLTLLVGAVLTVIPFPFLPFYPEQTLEHYLAHLVYGLAQVPLVVSIFMEIQRTQRATAI